MAERMCAGCRERGERDALLRFAIAPVEPFLFADPKRKLPGRGVSIHPTRKCLELAHKRGGFARALGKKPPALAKLVDQLQEAYKRRLVGLTSSAKGASAVLLGYEAVSSAPAAQLSLLFCSADLSEGRVSSLKHIPGVGTRCPIIFVSSHARLGELFGRAELAVVAVTDGGIAKSVAAVVDAASELGVKL